MLLLQQILSAPIHSGVKRLIFGAYNPKSGAVESIIGFPFEKVNHNAEIKGGILEDECSKIVKDFFKHKC